MIIFGADAVVIVRLFVWLFSISDGHDYDCSLTMYIFVNRPFMNLTIIQSNLIVLKRDKDWNCHQLFGAHFYFDAIEFRLQQVRACFENKFLKLMIIRWWEITHDWKSIVSKNKFVASSIFAVNTWFHVKDDHPCFCWIVEATKLVATISLNSNPHRDLWTTKENKPITVIQN